MEHRIPYHFAKNKGVIDAGEQEGKIQIWARDDIDPLTLSEVRRVLLRPLAVSLYPPEEFEQRLAAVYSRGDSQAASVVEDVEQDYDLSRLAQELPEIEDLLEAEDDAPIIRLINAVLTQALREYASDIHIEPFETRSVVRFRIDGKLVDVIEPKRALHAALVSRIKVMANLDISEKRLPQDGRITLRIAGRPVDVRVSTLPTGHGERVVLRLLDKSAGKMDLARLGMSPATLNQLRELIAQPHGIILVTGPTGSGKTTTLYAALGQMDAKTTNIMTVEDPIEYDLDGVGQTQVNSRIEMNFARALRSILRQDPDVIMIGEIRDLETAQIAVQASLTGHLVLATLHTNDAASAVTRLVDMGIEPFLLASSLIGVLAQRLARNLCPECKREHHPDEAERAMLGRDGPIYRPVGCPACNFNGFKGRSGLYELLTVDDLMRRHIHDGTSEGMIRDYAVNKGMLTLRQDGVRKILAGETSLEEVLRVTRD
ncbi:type II secretion system ATPase GspE [Chitinivorax sp. B]|uniref:type II secretion system ATPase GspE n=1 Tax=Chitinivorax sp. B TaxID=2502235 RepID=UPI0010FA005F|nr:type II secretion system ATPase GspE [Chitinivorax sp. B]